MEVLVRKEKNIGIMFQVFIILLAVIKLKQLN